MDRLTAYNTLGLDSNASEDDIKAAYKTLAQKYDVEKYSAGPMRDDAAQKMDEINEAFDVLMSFMRTGQENASVSAAPGSHSSMGQYAAVRQMINTGRVDEALAELSALQNVANDAEWNFLMGSAYYYKGWLDQARYYFQNAVRLAPGNREYEAALRNLQDSSQGEMNGNPYGNGDPSAAAMNCACNTCSLMCCINSCCGMGRGC